ncbi:MAG: AraC family transcriptional regulator [Candidatus Thiodiazotropha sp.]
MTDFTLPMQYIRQIADLLADMGVDLEQWLEPAGLNETVLADMNWILTYEQFQRLIFEAIRMSNEPALGLLVGERLRITSHGMLGFAAMNCASLRQAIALFEDFVQLRFSLISARLEVMDEEARVHFEVTQPLAELEIPVLEAVVLTVKNLLDHISMGSCQISRISFAYPEPGYGGLARDLFKCQLHYDQSWNGLVLPLQVIDQSLEVADPSSFDEAARICQRELEKRDALTSLGDRVRRLMLDKQSGFPSLSVTARLLHMTPRTLHRRLKEEGTSYQIIIDQVRRRLAVQYLQTSKFTIQEIAFNLGYTDPANFRRAFKRWENLSPSEYVKRHNET